MRELELQPFHDALRAALGGEPVDALLREAAALLGVALPSAPAPAASAASEGPLVVALALDHFVGEHDEGLAGGRWIERWQAERVLPEPELTGVALTLGRRKARPRIDSAPLPADVLHDDRFRRAIGVNEHDGVTWFNRELFEHAVTSLDLPRLRELIAAAGKSGYRLDELERRLATPPKRASAPQPKQTSTRPVRQRTAKPSTQAPRKSEKK